jgi:hypothetical protein
MFNTTQGHVSWQNMLTRCTNPTFQHYRRYGGATPPVKVCDRWLVCANFLSDMGERPRGTSLSRFGDVGNYEPGNCAWHTVAQQQAEARKKKMAVKKPVQSVRTVSVK